ncbi:MAG: hypothetical protein WDN08_05420 [Rhizomicrobium sp.]
MTITPELIVLVGLSSFCAALLLLEWKAFWCFLRILLTEDDADRVWCWARVSAAIGMVAFLAFCAIDVAVNKNAFAMVQFAGGLAALIAAGGAAIKLKGNL